MLRDDEKKALKEFQNLLKKAPLDHDEHIGLAFFICASDRTKLIERCNQMSKFLRENPTASYDEIQDYADVILGIE